MGTTHSDDTHLRAWRDALSHRRYHPNIVGVLLTTLVLGACGVQAGPSVRPFVTPADRPLRSDARATPGTTGELGRRAGFNPGSGILWMNDADRRRELDAMAATGARWIALDFDWNSIQGDGPTSFRWDRATDTVVRQARARGLEIIGSLGYSPPWARRSACSHTSHCFPTDPGAFSRFAAAAVARYGANAPDAEWRGSVRVWQIWNEANHFPFVQPTVDVAGYTTMLRLAYAEIKTRDPGATVLAGATAPAPDDPRGTDMAPVTFLRAIYAHGGGGSFDAFSHHPYTFPDSPLDDAPWNAFTQTRALHDVMVQHGDGEKLIWGTEAGAGTGTDPKAVSATRQAQLLREYYTGWNGSYRNFTGPLLWFSVRDSSPDAARIYDNFGVLRHDFTSKPARSVLMAVLRGG